MKATGLINTVDSKNVFKLMLNESYKTYKHHGLSKCLQSDGKWELEMSHNWPILNESYKSYKRHGI